MFVVFIWVFVLGVFCYVLMSHARGRQRYHTLVTVVPGFRVLGFSALPGFRALKADDRAWSVHKTLFGFKAPI